MSESIFKQVSISERIDITFQCPTEQISQLHSICRENGFEFSETYYKSHTKIIKLLNVTIGELVNNGALRGFIFNF